MGLKLVQVIRRTSQVFAVRALIAHGGGIRSCWLGLIMTLVGTVVVQGAESPQPLLQITSESAAQVIRPTAKQPVRFTLNIPDEPVWSHLNIGQCTVREVTKQRNLPVRITSPKQNTVDYTFEESGFGLVAVCYGPSDGVQRSDTWRHVTQCTKRIVRIVGEARKGESTPKDPGVTAKVGQRFEIVPMISPAVLRPGDDLPIRVFVDYEKAISASVVAYAPDGSKHETTTDSVGAANIPIKRPGLWLIRHERVVDRVRIVAELVFEVEGTTQAEENRP
ncbi:MAG: DUF4198 domain-containing protein [Planctomycetota bacterium]|mgnify:CR=1 FL=1